VQVGKQVGGRFGLGLMAWLPAKRLYRLSNTDPALPHYAFYNNRPQRYVIAAGFGGEVVQGVNIGVSADVHSRAKFDLYGTLDATVTSPDDPDTGVDELVTEIRVDVHDLELDLGYAIRPIVGVQLELGKWSERLDGLVVGATWRPKIGVRVVADLDIQANVAIEDIGDLDPFLLGSIVQARAILYDLYVPTRVGLGLAWRSDEVFSAYTDATYEGWKGAELAVTTLESADITAPLISIDDAIVDGNAYEARFRDTVTFRAGMELELHPWELDNELRYLRLVFRGGFAYAPTPLTAQGPMSAFLDADRVSFTIGVGSETWDPFALVDGPVRFDLYAQLHQIGRTTLPHAAEEPTAGFPREGSGIPIGGSIVVVGGEWGFEY
jgi:long-subunit fatty acid transport protein